MYCEPLRVLFLSLHVTFMSVHLNFSFIFHILIRAEAFLMSCTFCFADVSMAVMYLHLVEQDFNIKNNVY